MADQKLIDLTEDTSPALTEIIYEVKSPGGTPVDRKVTLQNVMELAPHYVDRGDPAAVDYSVGSFTTDDTWRDLDLSSIVPAGATAVHIKVQLADNAAGSYFQLRENGNSNAINNLSIRTQVANIDIDGNGFVTCDTNRVIEYRGANLTFTTINVTIRGWIIDTVN